MSSRLTAAGAVLLVALAGCAGGDGTPAQADADPTTDLGLVATATTGIIRGVVVDDAIRPLANVTVTAAGPSGERTTASNANGAFGFDGLEAGTYFLRAAKPGYFPLQSSVEVVAGVAEPPIVKVQMAVDVASTPFVQIQSFDGFIECTTSFLVLCGAPNLLLTLWCNGDLDPLPPACVGNVTNDRFTSDFYFADNASHIQFEMVWETNQALSPELYFELETLNGGCDYDEADRRNGGEEDDASAFLNNTRGTSPIYSTVNATQIHWWQIGSVCPIYFSIFSGGVSGAPCDPVLTGWCVGFTVEQRIRLFMHDFHGFLPAPGWRFAIDGAPPVPA